MDYIVHEVTKSRAQLSGFHFLFMISSLQRRAGEAEGEDTADKVKSHSGVEP